MKSIAMAICLTASGAMTLEAQTAAPAIIPQPERLEMRAGFFTLEHGVTIDADVKSGPTGKYLAERLRKGTGWKAIKGDPDSGVIRLSVDGAMPGLGPEGYKLTVTPDSVEIHGVDEPGVFYGVQTLLQLLPPEIFSTGPTADVEWRIPCVQIEDQPRFKWRGMMLDVSRHFFNKEEVKTMLDAMALHKMNSFHWHLTDDQGWRIEIKKYPKLTEIGAWRKNIGFGLDPKDGTAFAAKGRYGGYYTRADIREVVAYAAARHITVVPEIEMPGHACAALMAYPQYSCTGGPFTTDLPGGIFNGIYCTGNDEAFKFVENVLAEVFELFPGKYIHVGGDEVLVDNWKKCPKCQARMKEQGLTKEADLEGYFIRRVEKFINAHHRNLIGWSEIREGGLAQNATVMDWAGGAVESAMAGHDVVMSPLADCYFDHYQTTNQAVEPHAIGGYLPLPQVYAFEPMPEKLEAQFQSHILGAQANVWTEYMPNFRHVEYMVFPRLCALAEVDWTPKAARNYDDFARRLEIHGRRLDALGLNRRHYRADAQ
jgi:hexosaminidase